MSSYQRPSVESEIDDLESVTTGVIGTPPSSTPGTPTQSNVSPTPHATADPPSSKMHYHLWPCTKVLTRESEPGKVISERVYGVTVAISQDMEDTFRKHGYGGMIEELSEEDKYQAVPSGWWSDMIGLLPIVKRLTREDPKEGSRAAAALQELITSSPNLDPSQFTVHEDIQSLKDATKGGRTLSINEGIGREVWPVSVVDVGKKEQIAQSKKLISGTTAKVLPFYNRLSGCEPLPIDLPKLVIKAFAINENLTCTHWTPDYASPRSASDALSALCSLLETEQSMNTSENMDLQYFRGIDPDPNMSRNEQPISEATKFRAAMVDTHLRRLIGNSDHEQVRAIRFKVFAGDQTRKHFRAADRVVCSEDSSGTIMLNYPDDPWQE